MKYAYLKKKNIKIDFGRVVKQKFVLLATFLPNNNNKIKSFVQALCYFQEVCNILTRSDKKLSRNYIHRLQKRVLRKTRFMFYSTG